MLRALGLNDELAHSSIRFTLGRYTTEEEIDYTINLVKGAVENFVHYRHYGICLKKVSTLVQLSGQLTRI